MKNPRSTKSRQDRSVRDGRGQGEGSEYRSHIPLARNELASRGRSAYTPGLVVDRHHEELSHLESKINLVLPLLRPLNVREGYRMELIGVEDEFESEYPHARGTIEVADSLSYRHPRVEDGTPFVMSTDFVVTRVNHKNYAVNGKYERDLQDTRTRELIHIEKAYWADRGARHFVATEKHFDRKLVNNLEVMASFQKANVLDVPDAWFNALSHAARTMPMLEALRSIDPRPVNLLVDTVKHAVATGRISTDLVSRQLRWGMVWPVIDPRGVNVAWFDESAGELE